MKKFFQAAFSLTMVSSLFISTAFAQDGLMASANPASTSKSVKVAEGKKTSTEVVNPIEVTSKVSRNFLRNFRTMEGVLWKETPDAYVAEFRSGDRLALAWFSKSGILRYTNYYGTAGHLPAEEKSIVKSAYPGYEVTATVEIRIQNEVNWIVTLQNCDYIKKVNVVDGATQEMENMKRLK
jgi:hypothetical protein